MIYVVARAEVKPECREAYTEVLQKYVPQVLGEGGCIRYEPCLDYEEETGKLYVTMMETWASKAHLDAHLASPNMASFREKVAPMRVGKAQMMLLKTMLR